MCPHTSIQALAAIAAGFGTGFFGQYLHLNDRDHVYRTLSILSWILGSLMILAITETYGLWSDQRWKDTLLISLYMAGTFPHPNMSFSDVRISNRTAGTDYMGYVEYGAIYTVATIPIITIILALTEYDPLIWLFPLVGLIPVSGYAVAFAFRPKRIFVGILYERNLWGIHTALNSAIFIHLYIK